MLISHGEQTAGTLAGAPVDSLAALSQRECVSTCLTLLAAYSVLLHRTTGKDVVRIGLPAGEPPEPAEPFGLTSSLVVEIDCTGNPTFRELLRRLRDGVSQAQENQPCGQFADLLSPAAPFDRRTVFQIDLNDHELPVAVGPGTRQAVAYLGHAKPKSAVVFAERDGELTSELPESSHPSRGGYEWATLERLRKLLEGIVADPALPIAKLPLLSAAERRQLVVEWNDTAREYPREASLDQLIDAQAERRPLAVALVFGDREMTYGEFSRQANLLALELKTLGVGPETLVGICAERSLEMVVGVYAILKAGAAYVPLDPEFPKERLAYMLSDTRAPVLLTQRRLAAVLPEHEAAMVYLDEPRAAAEAADDRACTSVAGSERLAYVIYTSGSTGHPKGVMVPHRAVVNFLRAMQRELDVTERDVLLAVTTLSFDIAGLELFLPLTVGAKVVIADRGSTADGGALAGLLAGSGATMVQATPITWRLLLAAGWNASPGLKILCGGEPLPVDLAESLLASGGALWNLYGPTETTIWSTVRRVDSRDEPISIGRPIDNTQVYLLDAHRQPVPCGAIGEICIGGDGLARGYLNRPELTAEKFIRDPFREDPKSRLYTTGDLARWLPEGRLEFLGRLDDQVKIRGCRVELGDVESALRHHSQVAEAVVLAREDSPGEKRLVAYLVLEHGTELPPAVLRKDLREKLPEYMVPAAFVFLDRLPRTLNGKLDRRSLPVPGVERPEMAHPYVAPRTPMEASLAQIWAEALGLEPVGIDDNFFELGGHSLLAVRVFAQVERIFGKKLPLAMLCQSPTIAQLAGILGQEGWSADWSPLVPIQPRGKHAALFCIHGVGGNVLGFEGLARRLGAGQPVYGLQAQGLDGKQAPHARIEDMAECYLRAIRGLQADGPYFLAGHSFGGLVAFEIAQQLVAQGQSVGLLALFDTEPGYRQALDQGVVPASRTKRFFERVRFHATAFWQVPGRQKPAYFASKFATMKRRTKSRLWQQVYRLCTLVAAGEHQIPAALRNVEECCWLAARRYIPKAYAGKLSLFRAQERGANPGYDPQAGWFNIAAGGVEVHEIIGDHDSMLSEPGVRILAERLTECLDRARTAAVQIGREPAIRSARTLAPAQLSS